MGRRATETRPWGGIRTGGNKDRGERRNAASLCFYARTAFILLVLCLIMLSLFTHRSQASEIQTTEASKVNAKAKFRFGYDNNVSERRADRIESRFLQLYVNSGMYILPADRTLLSLKLQNGLKYLDASSLSGESVLINGLNLHLSHRLSEWLIPEIRSEIRGRTSIHSKSGVPPSEEAYLRGSAGAALKVMLLSDITGRVFYDYKFTNFEDFDPFDRRGPQMGLRTDVKLLPDSTVRLQYSRAKTRFYRWELISHDAEISRTDTVDEVSVSTQIYKYFLFDIAYSYQNNKSDVDIYSYRANRFAVLMARNLPQDIMFQLYALIRHIKYHSSSGEPALTQVELEDDERGVLTIKLSRDISEGCSLAIQCDLRRSNSYSEDGLYTKGVFSSSLSFHF